MHVDEFTGKKMCKLTSMGFFSGQVGDTCNILFGVKI